MVEDIRTERMKRRLAHGKLHDQYLECVLLRKSENEVSSFPCCVCCIKHLVVKRGREREWFSSTLGWFLSSGYETAGTHSDLTPLLSQIRLHILQRHQSTLSFGDGDKRRELTITEIYFNKSLNILLIHFCRLMIKESSVQNGSSVIVM